jgi:Lrp/AsnC family transcriptional regulator, leucine-responsive regulatory protein
MSLDKIDKHIVMLLQEDAKQTTKEISNKTGLSVTAVYERIKKLERDKIIDKYVALINKNNVDKGFMVLCRIKLEKHSKAYLTKFETEVGKIDEVLECYNITGDYDYLLKILVRDMDSYREFMVTKLTTLNHIGSTRSTFVISSIKNTTSILL